MPDIPADVPTTAGVSFAPFRGLFNQTLAYLRQPVTSSVGGNGNGTSPTSSSADIVLPGGTLTTRAGKKLRARLECDLFGTGNVTVILLIDGFEVRRRLVNVGATIASGDCQSLPITKFAGDHTYSAIVRPEAGKNVAVLNTNDSRYVLELEETS